MWRLRVTRRFLHKLGNGDNWQSYPAMMNLFMEVH